MTHWHRKHVIIMIACFIYFLPGKSDCLTNSLYDLLTMFSGVKVIFMAEIQVSRSFTQIM